MSDKNFVCGVCGKGYKNEDEIVIRLNDLKTDIHNLSLLVHRYITDNTVEK